MDKKDVEEFLADCLSKDAIARATEMWKNDKLIASWLWKIIIKNQHPISWRAAWLFEHMAFANPAIAFPYINEIVQALPHFNHNGQKRHALKIIQLYNISEKNKVHLINHCFDFLMSKTEPVAVKMNSINILYTISLSIPDIQPELIATIEQNLPDASSGFRNSATNILKKIK